jgi:hypothetical protein
LIVKGNIAPSKIGGKKILQTRNTPGKTIAIDEMQGRGSSADIARAGRFFRRKASSINLT